MMDNPSLVARLVALNERTRKAWAHPHNKKHYVPASFQGFRERGRSSRESTPADTDMIKNVRKEDTEPELRLYLHNRPRDITKGWVFGSDKSACDIYCGEYDVESNYNIGRQTFSITLNEQGQVVLKHLKNTNGTQVQYDSQNDGPRQEFVWVMLPYCRDIYVSSAKQLKFQVKVLQPREQTNLCLKFRSVFLTDVWFLDSSSKASSPPPKKQQEPFYYVRKNRPLGSGSFGKVYVVVDVSTGIEYAGKTFHGEVSRSEAEILAKQNHVNILGYVKLSNNDGPLLVTDYLKEGNLARPWVEQDRPNWEIDQIVSILAQSLRALAKLHARPDPVIHRDIKPENILVANLSSGPNDGESGPHIKLADFGLAIEGTRCIGESGTYAYIAPEVYDPGCYSSKADMWSLGVVILQLLMDGSLPNPSEYMQGTKWCFDIMVAALVSCNDSRDRDKRELRENEHSLRALTCNFVRLFMLNYDPNDRLSAHDCLDHDIFRQMYLGSRRNGKGWIRQEETIYTDQGPFTRLTLRKQFKTSPMPKVPSSDPFGEALGPELPDYARLTSSSATSSKKKGSTVRPAPYGSEITPAQALMDQDTMDWGDPPLPIGFGLVFVSPDEKTVKQPGKKAGSRALKY